MSAVLPLPQRIAARVSWHWAMLRRWWRQHVKRQQVEPRWHTRKGPRV